MPLGEIETGAWREVDTGECESNADRESIMSTGYTLVRVAGQWNSQAGERTPGELGGRRTENRVRESWRKFRFT